MPNDKPDVKGARSQTFSLAALNRAVTEARKEGHAEGLQKGRQEILDWLQAAYLDDPGRPDRGTPEAEAILKLVNNASIHFLKLVKPRKSRRK